MSVPVHRIRGGSAREVARSVEESVAAGRLAPGQALPSVRALAADLGLSPTTVAAAVAELRRRGVVRTEARRRTVVADGRGGSGRPRPPAPRPGTVDLAGGGPDPALLPDLGPALRRVAAELRAPRGYGQPLVDPDLASWAREAFAAAGVDGRHLVACSGALDAVERALAASLRPGDAVAVEDPGYPDVLHLVRALGLVPLPVGLDEEGPRPDGLGAALAAGARAVVLTPRAQNPTGAALTTERAAHLAAVVASRPEVLVVEDDHLGVLGDAAVATATAGARRWLLARSVAKALGPDVRLAVAAGDGETVGAVGERLAAGPGWVSHLLQRLVVHLLADRGTADRLRRARAAYDARREALVAVLAAEGVHVRAPSGLNVWVPVPDEAAVCLALSDAGWAVAPGAPFRLSAPPGVRITTARLPAGDAPALAAALAAAVAPGAARQG